MRNEGEVKAFLEGLARGLEVALPEEEFCKLKADMVRALEG
jgi:hypothetical protein|tara:strand:+ start:127 stop:249 length:123 start_codon:yes stop_codon:yes gene_type:complete